MKIVSVAVASSMIAASVSLIITGALMAVTITPSNPEPAHMQKWAAEEGKAEYYLDPKTGNVAWRWKSCSSLYTTLTVP